MGIIIVPGIKQESTSIITLIEIFVYLLYSVRVRGENRNTRLSCNVTN